MSFSQHLATLLARYDGAALRPPLPLPPALAVAATQWQPLQAWCLAGAGPGGTPLLRPGALPRVQRRFTVAWWQGDDAVVDAWALQLDGSVQLASLPGRADRLLLRLRTKRHDACWWRPRQAGDPWDAGHLIASDAAARQLQQHFRPRRASLLIAGVMDARTLAASIAALQQRSETFRHPVRLLCLAAAPLPAALAQTVTRLVPPG